MSNWCNEFIRKQIGKIRESIGPERAVVALSGGVDSAVTAILAWKALEPAQLMVFTFDDGLRREGEPEWVRGVFSKKVGIPVEIIEVDGLLKCIEGIEEGEKRRVFYSNGFGVECGGVARDFGASFTLFGTSALDKKETQQGKQPQHNAWEDRGINTETEYGFKVVEPLKTLYKDKIRELARALELPSEISERMPFPGPGLAIRMLDPVTPERVELVRRATKRVEDNLLPLKPFQCLACLMSGLATGKREGKGFFGQIISIRCVDSEDSGETATATLIPLEIKQKTVGQILSFEEVARVVIDRTPKPPGRIEYI